MYVPQDYMWWEIWEILQNILETKQGLIVIGKIDNSILIQSV